MDYHPFNPSKALAHLHYWQEIHTLRSIPEPLFVLLSPTNRCDMSCRWCMAEKAHEGLNAQMMWTKETTSDIVDIVDSWGTQAVYITGGGEPLFFPFFSNLTHYLDEVRGLQKAVFTNGVRMHQHMADLAKFDWVGVSVDAANAETWTDLKYQNRINRWNAATKERRWGRLRANIQLLAVAGDVEVTWKHLVYPGNEEEILDGALLAKDAGARYFHLRPAAPRWWDEESIWMSKDQIAEANRQTKEALKLSDDQFRVIAGNFKFDKNWKPTHKFTKCYAAACMAMFEGDGTVQLCCDRRGDPDLTLCQWDEAPEVWGSQRHWDLIDKIDVNKCPKCTMSGINEVFENVIVNDKSWVYFL